MFFSINQLNTHGNFPYAKDINIEIISYFMIETVSPFFVWSSSMSPAFYLLLTYTFLTSLSLPISVSFFSHFFYIPLTLLRIASWSSLSVTSSLWTMSNLVTVMSIRDALDLDSSTTSNRQVSTSLVPSPTSAIMAAACVKWVWHISPHFLVLLTQHTRILAGQSDCSKILYYNSIINTVGNNCMSFDTASARNGQLCFSSSPWYHARSVHHRAGNFQAHISIFIIVVLFTI